MNRISALSAIIAFVLAGFASGPSIAESASTRTEICKETNEQEISALFERWNASLQTGDPKKVAANYAEFLDQLPGRSQRLLRRVMVERVPRFPADELRDMTLERRLNIEQMNLHRRVLQEFVDDLPHRVL